MILCTVNMYCPTLQVQDRGLILPVYMRETAFPPYPCERGGLYIQ